VLPRLTITKSVSRVSDDRRSARRPRTPVQRLILAVVGQAEGAGAQEAQAGAPKGQDPWEPGPVSRGQEASSGAPRERGARGSLPLADQTGVRACSAAHAARGEAEMQKERTPDSPAEQYQAFRDVRNLTCSESLAALAKPVGRCCPCFAACVALMALVAVIVVVVVLGSLCHWHPERCNCRPLPSCLEPLATHKPCCILLLR